MLSVIGAENMDTSRPTVRSCSAITATFQVTILRIVTSTSRSCLSNQDRTKHLPRRVRGQQGGRINQQLDRTRSQAGRIRQQSQTSKQGHSRRLFTVVNASGVQYQVTGSQIVLHSRTANSSTQRLNVHWMLERLNAHWMLERHKMLDASARGLGNRLLLLGSKTLHLLPISLLLDLLPILEPKGRLASQSRHQATAWVLDKVMTLTALSPQDCCQPSLAGEGLS